MRETYVAPEMRELGSLTDLTLQSFNKVGTTPDTFTAITNNIVIGSLTTP